METDTAMEAWQRLEQLRDDLTGSGWPCNLAGTRDQPVLRVRNPWVPVMEDEIVYTGDTFCWAWGPKIGDNAQDVAQVIRHVLREVSGP
ncbi:hypothetical protein [Nonomuraea typhae]|uniref:Uncharacterized protein n=1 Tax=Nonomuraea typhae TaxID=2603600 RepID=A0ABW7Z2F3_9ACTN